VDRDVQVGRGWAFKGFEAGDKGHSSHEDTHFMRIAAAIAALCCWIMLRSCSSSFSLCKLFEAQAQL